MNNVALPGVDYTLPAGYGPGTAAAINAVMAAVAGIGGGEVILPSETISLDAAIDNKWAHVLVKSYNRGVGWHDGGAAITGQGTGCVLVPSFTGTVLRHRTPSASELGYLPCKNHGGGFAGFSVLGNSIAARGLQVTSIDHGVYDLFLANFEGTEAALFDCLVTGTDIGEAADIQKAKIALRIRQIDTVGARNCGGVVLTGSSNANVSFVQEIDIDVEHWNGIALDVKSADNNDFSCVRAIRAGGTGKSVVMRGPTSSHPVGGDSNRFHRLSSSADIYAEGTDTSGVTAGVLNIIDALDLGNGTPVPTHGTGSDWAVRTAMGTNYSMAVNKLALANTDADAKAMRARMGNSSLVMTNNADDHARIVSGSGEWAYGMGGADLREIRIAGSGAVNIGNGAPVKIGNKVISEGAANSGGTGFKVLRDPN